MRWTRPGRTRGRTRFWRGTGPLLQGADGAVVVSGLDGYPDPNVVAARAGSRDAARE